MNITIFNKKYWVRRFGKPKNVRGYITSGREDFVASLHVHPMGSDAMQALPEGERKMKHLEGHGTAVLIPANQETGVKGDLLFYHTVLSHINYQFCLVPTNSPRSADIKDPPTAVPDAPSETEQPEEPDEEIPVATDKSVGGVMVKDGSGLKIDEEGYLSIDEASKESVRSLMGDGGDSP